MNINNTDTYVVVKIYSNGFEETVSEQTDRDTARFIEQRLLDGDDFYYDIKNTINEMDK